MSVLAGRRAFVTGAGSGIGWETARALAGAGAAVFATSVAADGLDDAFAELRTHGVDTAVLDVTDEAMVEAAVADAVAALGGPIDIVSSNAGIELVRSPAVTETTLDEWRGVLDVNLTGAFLVCRAAIPHMADGGSIVIMGSTKSLVGRINAAAYVASKTGLLGFTRALALELGPRGIRVNCVCPGTIESPLTRAFLDQAADPDAQLAAYAAKAPLGRIGTPGEVASCVVFLASADASFVNGTALVVDGGALAG